MHFYTYPTDITNDELKAFWFVSQSNKFSGGIVVITTKLKCILATRLSHNLLGSAII